MDSELDELQYEARAIQAQGLVRAGRLEEASRLLADLPPGVRMRGWLQEKVIALVALAEGLLRRGDIDEAEETLSNAERECAALGEGSTWEAADSLAGIGKRWLEAGNKGKAIQTLEVAARLARKRERVDPDCRKILRDIAGFLSEAGEQVRATKVANLIEHDRRLRNEALRRAKGKQ